MFYVSETNKTIWNKINIYINKNFGKLRLYSTHKLGNFRKENKKLMQKYRYNTHIIRFFQIYN